ELQGKNTKLPHGVALARVRPIHLAGGGARALRLVVDVVPERAATRGLDPRRGVQHALRRFACEVLAIDTTGVLAVCVLGAAGLEIPGRKDDLLAGQLTAFNRACRKRAAVAGAVPSAVAGA